MTARDKAIRELQRLFDLAHNGGNDTSAIDCAPVIDAIIEAARAPESEHSREVQRAIDAVGTAGGKATTETIKP